MGYTLSIRRDQHIKISVQEWEIYISSDPEFELINTYQAKTLSGKEIKISMPHSAAWNNDARRVPFRYHERMGTISVDLADEWVLEKMKSIAQALHAKVVGEEGETY